MMKLLHCIALVGALVATRTARAQPAGGGDTEIGVTMNVVVPDEKDPKEKGKAPSLEATIVNGPKVPLEKFTISTIGADKQRVTMKATKLREYTEGKETIAIALVINGQELWVGNEEVEQDPTAAYPGALKNLEGAIDKMGLSNAGPKGSKGVIISYSNGAEVKGTGVIDLEKITGAALGSERDYYKHLGTDMVQGIQLAYAKLKEITASRKAMIVVGDGTDTDADKAKSALADLKKKLKAENIQAFAIIYKPREELNERPQVITTLIPGVKTVNSMDGIAAALAEIVESMKNRYYVTFAGFDENLGVGLPWDTKDHDLTIKIDQTELEPVTMPLAPKWEPPKSGGFPWLIVILVFVGLIVLIIIAAKVFGGKPAPQPMPVAMPQMPQMPMEAPKQAGPMKTVMIGAGGDQDGFPIVGWLVPLNGVDAYKTMRLRSGMTKIGTAPPADLVINDGFMSTEHCQIACSPAGFTLIDIGATNGCYVNDRKVQKHELVDNDMITLGKTNFKFKSIN
ncbi:MAG TPA: FHA domain-containing protein [Kofleriaceae bacterium]|jgi:hypothetical protein